MRTVNVLGEPITTFARHGVAYQMPVCLAGRYELTGVLASGGFGTIFTARDLRIFDRKVLVKANRYEAHLFQFPHDLARERVIVEQRERLRHEMKMLRLAQQRRVAGTPILIDLVEGPAPHLYGPHHCADGRSFTLPEALCLREPYLILNFIEGVTLDRACSQKSFRRNLLGSIKHVLFQLSGVLEAFHRYAPVGEHELSFIYQDLKPQNVIWTHTKRVVLIDFGSFAVRTKEQVIPKNVFVSTPPYQPPEFSQSYSPEESIRPTADVYSLGVTLLHLLAGEEPMFSDVGEIEWQRYQRALPPQWLTWLKKATAHDPDERFPTMLKALQVARSLPIKTPGDV